MQQRTGSSGISELYSELSERSCEGSHIFLRKRLYAGDIRRYPGRKDVPVIFCGFHHQSESGDTAGVPVDVRTADIIPEDKPGGFFFADTALFVEFYEVFKGIDKDVSAAGTRIYKTYTGRGQNRILFRENFFSAEVKLRGRYFSAEVFP